eukprot:gnl/Trimastix_PCT/1522.p3 GENE.gnl/Trimastix_PCT/1522~~gnl/Trimastix_PCT/1522.p3  ORF type:complete len:178 (-),score=32.79 gnl/Trimastix_PCT/1522:1357-1890(-)
MSKTESPVNLLDAKETKGFLDRTVQEILLEDNHQLSHKFEDIRIWLGLFACAAAAVSHFFPLEFPHNIPVLLICCIIYFTCLGILELVALFWQRDTIVVTRPQKRNAGLIVESALPHFSTHYTLRVSLDLSQKQEPVAARVRLERLFDTRGSLHRATLAAQVRKLVQQCRSSKKGME